MQFNIESELILQLISFPKNVFGKYFHQFYHSHKCSPDYFVLKFMSHFNVSGTMELSWCSVALLFSQKEQVLRHTMKDCLIATES